MKKNTLENSQRGDWTKQVQQLEVDFRNESLICWRDSVGKMLKINKFHLKF